MKLQTILCAAALAVLPSFAAELFSENTCGWMEINSSLTNTIVAVPWVEVDTGNAIKVEKLVKTDNLAAGDFLWVYDHENKTWYSYKLEGSPLAWGATVTVNQEGASAPGTAADRPLPRGSAIFLQRNSGDLSKPFYIYGQYQTDSTPLTTTVESGSGSAKDAVAYTLVANPRGVAFDLNGRTKTVGGEEVANVTGAQSGDKIVIPNDDGSSSIYVYDGTQEKKWRYHTFVDTSITLNGKPVQEKQWREAPPIEMGRGFWYVSVGSGATFNW